MFDFRKFSAASVALIMSVSLMTSCAETDNTSDGTIVAEAASSAATTTSAAPESKYKLSVDAPIAQAQSVYDYICETYGSAIISGQQESTWINNNPQFEMEYIEEHTGKLPAIRGLDYMNDDFSGVNTRAEEWWNKGGIVTICWHCGSDFSGSWSQCMETNIDDWDKALTEGTEEYAKLIEGMDKGAEALTELRDKGIPVLWRPFHELDGGWFWWSKGGAENFKKLWNIMYDRYTNHWELNNLIWVFGFSGNGKNYEDWYPGDSVVDIVGADSYNKGSNAKLYKLVDEVAADEKPICFHECGTIPTVKQLKDDGAGWVYFMTWHTEFISETKNNTVENLNEIFNDDYVITLDELPSFKDE